MERRDVIYRRATESDLYALLSLYQRALSGGPLYEPLLLDARRLRESLGSHKMLWIVGEQHRQLVACLYILLDRENRLARISRFVSDPTWENSEEMLRDSLPLLVRYLREKDVEVVYAATRTLTHAQQELTLQMGFKMLGIFPEARGMEFSKPSGLTAFYFDDVLKGKRFQDFALHPSVAPFFDIASRECSLESLPILDQVIDAEGSFEAMPSLELIHAPRFVSHRFEKLKEKRALSVHFYPFYEPNAVITDPEQRIEVFVSMLPESKFAAVIGERIDMSVNPVELYTQLSLLLHARGCAYLEIINDAADPWGIECILRAGFIPCGYFPAFKKQKDNRRDYVIFARAFEKLFIGGSGPVEVNSAYRDYLSEYYRLEAESYLSRIRVHEAPPVSRRADAFF